MRGAQSLEKLFELSTLYFSLPTPKFKRYLFDKIDFDSKIIGILGQRGVGKTTLIRQIAQNYELPPSKMLYISADNIADTLSSIAKEFSAFGGKLLIIDEMGLQLLSRQEASLFFRVVSSRYDRGSTITTTKSVSLDRCQNVRAHSLATKERKFPA